MAYLVGEETKNWIQSQRTHEGGRERRQYIPRFQTRGGGGGSGDVRILRITGGNALEGYTVSVYQNYVQAALDQSEGTARFFPTEIGLDGDLPYGTVVVGHKVQLSITGGSED